jgi:hypothetical protein
MKKIENVNVIKNWSFAAARRRFISIERPHRKGFGWKK